MVSHKPCIVTHTGEMLGVFSKRSDSRQESDTLVVNSSLASWGFGLNKAVNC